MAMWKTDDGLLQAHLTPSLGWRVTHIDDALYAADELEAKRLRAASFRTRRRVSEAFSAIAPVSDRWMLVGLRRRIHGTMFEVCRHTGGRRRGWSIGGIDRSVVIKVIGEDAYTALVCERFETQREAIEVARAVWHEVTADPDR